MVAYAGDRGSNPAARTILVVFFPVFIFFRRQLNSVFRLFSNIKALRLRFTFFRLSGLSSICHNVVYIGPISAVWSKNTAIGANIKLPLLIQAAVDPEKSICNPGVCIDVDLVMRIHVQRTGSRGFVALR